MEVQQLETVRQSALVQQSAGFDEIAGGQADRQGVDGHAVILKGHQVVDRRDETVTQ